MKKRCLQVLIIGNGFGGLYTALYLSKFNLVKSGRCEIFLVDSTDNFVFKPLLSDILSNDLEHWEFVTNYERLLWKTKVKFFCDSIEKIDLSRNRVILQSNLTIKYDYLVLEVGRKLNLSNLYGWSTNILAFRSLQDVAFLKNRLSILKNNLIRQRRIAIIGAGIKGVELACKISDFFYQKVTIYLIDRESEILVGAQPFLVKAAYEALENKNIELLLGNEVKKITSKTITLEITEIVTTYPIELVIWTNNIEDREFIYNLDLKHDLWGHFYTRRTLQLENYSRVFALGDVIHSGNQNNYLLPNELIQADIIARNIQRLIKKKSLKKCPRSKEHNILSLGKNNAIVYLFGIIFLKKSAIFLRRLIYISSFPTIKYRIQVLKKVLFGQ